MIGRYIDKALQIVSWVTYDGKTIGIAQKQPTEVFYKKGALRNFTKFTGKHLRQSPVFNKGAGLRPVT